MLGCGWGPATFAPPCLGFPESALFSYCRVGRREGGEGGLRQAIAVRQFCWVCRRLVLLCLSLLLRKGGNGGHSSQPTHLPRLPRQIISNVAQGHIDLHRIEQAVGGDCDRAVRIRRQALERLRSVGWVIDSPEVVPPLLFCLCCLCCCCCCCCKHCWCWVGVGVVQWRLFLSLSCGCGRG